MTHHRTILVLLVFPSLLALVVSAQDARNCQPTPQNAPGNEEYTRLCVPDWALNRTFSASTNAPTATALNERAQIVVPALQTLLMHMEKVARHAVFLRDNPPRRFLMPNEFFCNNRKKWPDPDRSYAPSVNVSTSQYGFGLVGEDCQTDLEHETNETFVDALTTYVDEVNKSVKTATSNAGLDWPNATSYFKFAYKSTTDRCNLWGVTGFRVRGRWGINTGITNAGLSAHKPEWERFYMVEVLRVDNQTGRIVPFPMTLRKPFDTVYNDSDFKTPYITEFIENSTTVMNTWSGVPSTSLFQTYNPATNPALEAAQQVGAATVEQIEDALTPSGMSILIAPIALTLLPLAIFTEVDSAATVLYTIATDILTVFPLAIKGVELIRYTNLRLEATRSRIYGGVEDSEVVSIETWYAKCEADNHVVVMGWLFLIMAIVFMMVGILLEIGARHMLKGKVVFGRTVGGSKHKNAWQHAHVMCSQCECAANLPYMKVPDHQACALTIHAPAPAFDKDFV